MARLIISDILPQWNGEHDVDLSYFTNREWHLIRERCGVYPPDLEMALNRRDAGVVVCLAGITLTRDGFDLSREEWALLWDARSGLITLDLTVTAEGEEVDDDVPLLERDDSNGERTESSPSARKESSGENSRSESDPSPTSLSGTGARG